MIQTEAIPVTHLANLAVEFTGVTLDELTCARVGCEKSNIRRVFEFSEGMEMFCLPHALPNGQRPEFDVLTSDNNLRELVCVRCGDTLFVCKKCLQGDDNFNFVPMRFLGAAMEFGCDEVLFVPPTDPMFWLHHAEKFRRNAIRSVNTDEWRNNIGFWANGSPHREVHEELNGISLRGEAYDEPHYWHCDECGTTEAFNVVNYDGLSENV
jgi:hypothetical protein